MGHQEETRERATAYRTERAGRAQPSVPTTGAGESAGIPRTHPRGETGGPSAGALSPALPVHHAPARVAAGVVRQRAGTVPPTSNRPSRALNGVEARAVPIEIPTECGAGRRGPNMSLSTSFPRARDCPGGRGCRSCPHPTHPRKRREDAQPTSPLTQRQRCAVPAPRGEIRTQSAEIPGSSPGAGTK